MAEPTIAMIETILKALIIGGAGIGVVVVCVDAIRTSSERRNRRKIEQWVNARCKNGRWR